MHESGYRGKGTAGQAVDAESAPTGGLLLESQVAVLAQALTSSGNDVVAMNAAGTVLYTTLDSSAEAAHDLLAFLSEHLERARAGGRMLFERAGRLHTIYPSSLELDGAPATLFSIRTKRTFAVHTGIDWLDAVSVSADFEQSAFGVIEGADALSPLVLQAHKRGTPIMLEGEAGSGKDATAELLYLQGGRTEQPFVRVSLDTLSERTWRHLLHGADSPLYQTDATLYIRGLHALGEARCRELVGAARDAALTERCRVIFSGNDIPGGGECDAVAAFAEQLHCAVCVASPLREMDENAARVERYLAHVAASFDLNTSPLEDDARAALNAYSWPRNYTQAREVAERLLITAGEEPITRENVEFVLAQEDVIRSGVFSSPALETDLYILRPLADTERDIARLVVKHLSGNKTRAADVLGISRTTLWRMLNA